MNTRLNQRPYEFGVKVSVATTLNRSKGGQFIWRVLFQRTADLVQRLQTARRELALEAYIAKLDLATWTDLGRRSGLERAFSSAKTNHGPT